MLDRTKPQASVKRNRKATEQTILTAFETVLLREGVRGLGVNAVAQEAGVNKVLIYRYFSDFPGLAREWANSSSFWPSELELIGNNVEAFDKLEVRERVSKVLNNYITAMRARPRSVELFAGELMSPSDVTRALVEGMAGRGKGVGEYIKFEAADTDITDRAWKLIFLVAALTAFFTVRERNNPDFMGFDLTQDESWAFLRDTLTEIATSYLKD